MLLRRFSLCNLLHSSVRLSVVSPDIVRSILFLSHSTSHRMKVRISHQYKPGRINYKRTTETNSAKHFAFLVDAEFSEHQQMWLLWEISSSRRLWRQQKKKRQNVTAKQPQIWAVSPNRRRAGYTPLHKDVLSNLRYCSVLARDVQNVSTVRSGTAVKR
jgi:hypothetical protein